MLTDLGLISRVTFACVFLLSVIGIDFVSHVDDFFCAGSGDQLKRFRSNLEDNYEVDGEVLGWQDGESRTRKFLGGILRYT